MYTNIMAKKDRTQKKKTSLATLELIDLKVISCAKNNVWIIVSLAEQVSAKMMTYTRSPVYQPISKIKNAK